MSSNDFQDLRALSNDVLSEVVREGEARVQAQLSVAIAADQRALTFAGFQIGSATAALAGGVALIVGEKADVALAALSLFFAAALLIAAWHALRTVRPEKFDLPGNSPVGWLPDNWLGAGRHRLDLRQARLEQAECLANMIEDNKACAEKAARRIHLSMDLTLWAVGSAAAFLGYIILARALHSSEALEACCFHLV